METKSFGEVPLGSTPKGTSMEMKKFRLSGASIIKVYKTGFRIHENGLFLYALKSPDGENRVAFIVRKKLFKSAVKRNRVRRVLREAYRISEYRNKDLKYWMVVDLKKWDLSLNKPHLFTEATELLKRVR